MRVQVGDLGGGPWKHEEERKECESKGRKKP